jgi:hypothetical protein
MATSIDNSYPLAMPEDAAYGRLAELAYAMQAPLGPAYVALAALYSGQGINMHDHRPVVRPTIFAALMGGAGDGKSTTMDRAEAILGYTDDNVQRCMGVSERGILSLFRRGLKRGEDPEVLGAAPLVIDEMVAFLAKMDIQNSTLQQLLNTLYYKDRVGVADKAGLCEMWARVSLLGCLKVDDADEFRERFGGRSQDGFYSRLILAPLPPDWKWDFTWRPTVHRVPTEAAQMADLLDKEAGQSLAYTETGAPATLLPARAVAMPDARFRQAAAWEQAHKDNGVKAGRLTEIAQRIALITASANGEAEVSEDCMAAALCFADWQLQVRKVYAASEALTDDAMIYDRVQSILREAIDAHRAGNPWLVRNGRRSLPVTKEERRFIWVSVRRLTQHSNLNRVAAKYGGQKVSHMFQALSNLELIEWEREGGKESITRTGWIRLADDAPIAKMEAA